MRLTESIEIAAPPQTVWEIASDVSRWPEWTPTVRSVEVLEGGEMAVGLKARLTQPGIPKATWTVTEVQPGAFFSWQAQNLGMTFVGGHGITPLGTGTKVMLTLDVMGWPARIFGRLMTRSLQNAIRTEAAGLKARAEDEASALRGIPH